MAKEEIPKGFIDAVNFTIKNADVILSMLDDLAKDYILGKDVKDQLRLMRETHSLLFRLIYDLYNKDDEVIRWLDKVVKEEDKWIFSKIESYSILSDLFKAVTAEEYGYLNTITSTSDTYTYSEDLMLPIIEIKLFSYNTKVLHFKEDIGYVVWLIASLTKSVLNCLEKLYSPKKFDFKYPQTTNGLRQTDREEDKVHCKTQAEGKEQQRDSV